MMDWDGRNVAQKAMMGWGAERRGGVWKAGMHGGEDGRLAKSLDRKFAGWETATICRKREKKVTVKVQGW